MQHVTIGNGGKPGVPDEEGKGGALDDVAIEEGELRCSSASLPLCWLRRGHPPYFGWIMRSVCAPLQPTCIAGTATPVSGSQCGRSVHEVIVHQHDGVAGEGTRQPNPVQPCVSLPVRSMRVACSPRMSGVGACAGGCLAGGRSWQLCHSAQRKLGAQSEHTSSHQHLIAAPCPDRTTPVVA